MCVFVQCVVNVNVSNLCGREEGADTDYKSINLVFVLPNNYSCIHSYTHNTRACISPHYILSCMAMHIPVPEYRGHHGVSVRNVSTRLFRQRNNDL